EGGGGVGEGCRRGAGLELGDPVARAPPVPPPAGDLSGQCRAFVRVDRHRHESLLFAKIRAAAQSSAPHESAPAPVLRVPVSRCRLRTPSGALRLPRTGTPSPTWARSRPDDRGRP